MRRAGLLAVVALFVVAGCDAPTRPQHGVRVKQFDVNGSMQADGTVQMQAVVVYPSDDGGPLRLGAPTLGVVADVRLDNSPRSSSAQTVDVDPRGVRTGVDWAVRGASERYEDGVIVTLPIWTPPDDVSGDDQRVPVRGALQLPAPPVGKVRWHGASPADLVVEGASIRYSGTIDTTRASELSFLLPSEALPAAPALPGASRVASYESREASADASDARIAGEIADTLRREDLEANLYWGAVGLEVAIPFVITLLVLLRAAGVRRRATRDVPDELSDAP
ncbi:MAG: hypothetical protein QOC92_4605, partial [Acidimicrobiaceae bacterium]